MRASEAPIICLNEYLIDDEEVLEYLILREMIHIKLNMYPPMRYGTPRQREIAGKILKRHPFFNQRLSTSFCILEVGVVSASRRVKSTSLGYWRSTS